MRTRGVAGRWMRAHGRKGLVGLAVVAVALSLGLGGATAFAYFTSRGTGTGSGAAERTVNVTVSATNGAADLLPGGSGSVYLTLHNPNSFGAAFNEVSAASISSTSNSSCPGSNISLATLPYIISPAVTVSGGGSETRDIASLVTLAANAPARAKE